MQVLSYPISIIVQCLEDAGEHASLPSPVMMPCIDRRGVHRGINFVKLIMIKLKYICVDAPL